MYSHYTPSLKNWAFCDALYRYGGCGCFFYRYGGCGSVFYRYDGGSSVQCSNERDCRIYDRIDLDCGQYNCVGCTLCQEKPPDRCQRI